MSNFVEKFPKVSWNKQDMTQHVKNAEYYIKKFSTWEASKIIIDDQKAIYILKKPDSRVEKVCMFVDGYNMYIYGDYGTLSFDRMTWVATPDNLAYQDMGYMMSKLSSNNYDSIHVFDEDKCKEDLENWFATYIKEYYHFQDDVIKQIIQALEEETFTYSLNLLEDVEAVLEKCTSGAEEISTEAEIFVKALENMYDREGWITFLNQFNDRIMDLNCYEETYIEMRDFGKIIDGRFYVNLLAMFILYNKLEGNM